MSLLLTQSNMKKKFSKHDNHNLLDVCALNLQDVLIEIVGEKDNVMHVKKKRKFTFGLQNKKKSIKMPKKWKNSLDVKLQKLMEKEYIYIFDHVQKTIKVFMQIGLKMLKETAVANKSFRQTQNAQFQIRKSRTCIFIRFYPCLQKINANLSQNNLKIDNENQGGELFWQTYKVVYEMHRSLPKIEPDICIMISRRMFLFGHQFSI